MGMIGNHRAPDQARPEVSRATVESLGQTYEIQLAAKAMTNLLVIQAWIRS
jgi:hypothetical protein